MSNFKQSSLRKEAIWRNRSFWNRHFRKSVILVIGHFGKWATWKMCHFENEQFETYFTSKLILLKISHFGNEPFLKKGHFEIDIFETKSFSKSVTSKNAPFEKCVTSKMSNLKHITSKSILSNMSDFRNEPFEKKVTSKSKLRKWFTSEMWSISKWKIFRNHPFSK